jgi:hypothetical protein
MKVNVGVERMLEHAYLLFPTFHSSSSSLFCFLIFLLYYFLLFKVPQINLQGRARSEN